MTGQTAFPQNNATRTFAEVSGSSESYVLATRNSCEWLSTAVQRLGEVSRLKQNWDSYDSNAVDIHAVHYAHCLLSWLTNHIGITQPKISATPSGNVCFFWETPDFEVEVCPNGLFLYLEGENEGETPDASEIAAILTVDKSA